MIVSIALDVCGTLQSIARAYSCGDKWMNTTEFEPNRREANRIEPNMVTSRINWLLIREHQLFPHFDCIIIA